MAVRMHVVGCADATADDLVAAFAEVGPGLVGERDGLAWMTLSARRASAHEIDHALDAVGAPALRASTVDGAYWVLRLSRPGAEDFVVEHHFPLLRVADLVLEERSLGELADRCGLGARVEHPEAEITQDAVDGLLAFQADAMADALGAFGFAFDRSEVVDILSGVTVTPMELGWDTGNLPRFLEALGMAEAVEGWRDELADEEEYMARQAAALAAVAADPLADARERLADADLTPLRGGPVTLPVSDAFLLLDLADQCAGGFAAGVALTADGNEAVAEAIRGLDGVYAAVSDGELQILADNWADLWPTTRGICAAMAAARDGSELELMTTQLYGESADADQRYAGRVEAGNFRIERACPAVDHDTLSEALVLMREGRARGAITLRDAQEGEAVLNEVADAIWFFYGPPEITLDGNRLTVDRDDAVEGIVQYLFIRRYGEVWNVAARAAFHRREAERARAE